MDTESNHDFRTVEHGNQKVRFTIEYAICKKDRCLPKILFRILDQGLDRKTGP